MCIGHPKLIRLRGDKLTIDQINWPLLGIVANSGPALSTTSDTLNAKPFHQAFHGAARRFYTFSFQLAPNFANSVHLLVLIPDPLNLDL